MRHARIRLHFARNMKPAAAPCHSPFHFHLLYLLLLYARTITSQSCQTIPVDGLYPNCTAPNTAFCEGGAGSPIIFRCFYPYGHACAGNCMDNLDEQYRDAACWESAPGVGDAQCAAGCVSVTAKNGSEFFPFGCDDGSSASSITGPISTTTTSLASTSTTPASTTTAQQSGSVVTTTTTATARSDATSRLGDGVGVAFGIGCVVHLAAALFAR